MTRLGWTKNVTFLNLKNSMQDAVTIARIFNNNYERGSNPDERARLATYWFNTL